MTNANQLQSRKAQKRLEKIVLRKKLKVDRKNVLAELKRVQLNPDQFYRLHSTSSMQTKGLKRFTEEKELSDPQRNLTDIERAEQCLDIALLINRKRKKIKKDSSGSSNSSEDTDAISTDTELYYESEDERLSKEHDSEGTREQKQLDSTKQKSTAASPIVNIQQPATTLDAVTIGVKAETRSEPAVYVPVNRRPDVEKSRLELPIIGEEQRIMEEIRYNNVVIISGETGSGKTTQIPQFLYEAGFTLNGKMIGITEPRRVAAISMSERVAHELNMRNAEVSYQIRFSGNVSDNTKIKFMTDGVLMRECQHDFLLSKYSVLIIDEAHERSVFSDILIGLLSRIVPLRAKKGHPLKLVIMSATLRVTDFTENSFLFPMKPPVINIDARQYPVTVQFAKKTPPDYITAAYKKVCLIHNRMPRGGILVFVTSQMDVNVLCKKLKKKSSIHCLGLYAMLPIEKQKLVFESPPENSRLCVIATNVAETSITIPNIKYVIDTGLEKRKIYDLLTGVSRFVTTWTSKSSAEQRTGRAGRMGPGHCYRLYSSSVFTNDFEQHAQPQILQKPVEDILLQMKAMNIDNVVNFPFPSRPSLDALISAEKKLILLGALDDSAFAHAKFKDISKTEFSSRPTALGRAMANYPVGARCSKMIVLAPHELLPHVISLVSALSVREMFYDGKKWIDIRKKWAGHGGFKLLGDFLVMLRAVCEADSFGYSDRKCTMRGLRTKAMLELDKLRRLLIGDVNTNRDICLPNINFKLQKPVEAQCKILRQLLLSSFSDHVARKIPDGEIRSHNTGEPERSGKKRLKHAYECLESEEPVYISSESVLKGKHPEFVIYKELYKGGKKTYMRDICVVDPVWFPFYASKLCKVCGKVDAPAPRYDKELDQVICKQVVTYGPLNWPLGLTDIPMNLVEFGGLELYKHFAAFLLAGDVIDWFKRYASKLLSPPTIMTKPWSKLQPRTNKILQVLVTNDVKSKKDLSMLWQVDKSFLKSEYLAWLPESIHSQVEHDWDLINA